MSGSPAPSAAPPARGTARGAAAVTLGILLARLFGLLRQRVVAHYLGVSAIADVVAAAFRVGNVAQHLLGEGALSASFIPIYARLRASGRAAEASAFARATLGAVLLATSGATVIGVLAAPLLARAVAPGFAPDVLAMTTRVVRFVFPMTGLLVVSAFGLGVLNAHRRFFLPYAAPTIWSAAQIAGLAIAGSALGARGEALAVALAISALVGAALQVLVLVPQTRALLGGLRPRLDVRDPHLREAARRLPGVILGRGVIQLAGLVDAAIVSFAGVGAQAAFQYAQAIYLVPLSLIGTGEAAAALPDLAVETAHEDRADRDALLRDRVGASLARVTVLAIPATAALAILGRPILRVVLQTGSFDAAATGRVERLLAAYAVALLGNAAGRVLVSASYAFGDTRTPARYAIYRVIASTAVAVALIGRIGALAVVLGSVVAAWVEALALGRKLHAELGGLGLARVPIGKAIVLAACAVAPAVAVDRLLPAATASGLLGASVVLAVFGCAFAIAAPALGLVDVRRLLRRP